MNTLPQKDKNTNFDQKSIVTVILAIVITFILFYLVYTLFISKDNFLLQKIQTPVSTSSSVMISDSTEQNFITADQIDELEQEIIQDGRLQQLQMYGSLSGQVTPTGNSNPFKPFEVRTTIENNREDLTFDDIEKPLPRVNNQ